MASAFHDSAHNEASGSGTTIANADALTVTTGDLVDLTIGWEGATAGSSISEIDDGNGNKLSTGQITLAATLLSHSNGDLRSVRYKFKATTTGTLTITATLSAARTFRSITAISVTPTAGQELAIDDASAQAQGSSSSPSAGAGTSSSTAGFAIASVRTYGARTATAGSGWTLPAELATLTDGGHAEHRVVSATGSITGDMTLSASNEYVAHLVIYKEVAAGGGGGPTANQPVDDNARRNKPGRGPYSLGRYFRPGIDAFANPVASGSTLSGQVDESLAFSDSQTGIATFSAQRDESIAFSDAQTGNIVASVQRDESVAFSDAQTAGVDTSATRAESIAFTDSQDSVIAISGQVDDSISFSDGQSAQVDFSAARAESIAFSDAQTAQAVLEAARAESVAFTDGQDATVLAGGTAQTDESIGFGDSQSASAVFSASVAEGIGFSDSQDATGGSSSGGQDGASTKPKRKRRPVDDSPEVFEPESTQPPAPVEVPAPVPAAQPTQPAVQRLRPVLEQLAEQRIAIAQQQERTRKAKAQEVERLQTLIDSRLQAVQAEALALASEQAEQDAEDEAAAMAAAEILLNS